MFHFMSHCRYTVHVIQALLSVTARVLHRPALVHALDDVAVVAGVVALLLALHGLALPASPLGLLVLAALALAVRVYPLAGRGSALAVTASTPLLAIMAVYGPAWTTVVATGALALDGALRVRRSGVEAWGRGVARAALAAALAGAAFAAMGATPGSLTLQLTLPALSAAEVVLALSSWALVAPTRAVETGAAYAALARESLLGALPALAAEPVLALVLAPVAMAPTPATLLAAVLPLAALIAALRLHADMRGRLERAHAALRRAHEQLRIQATTDALTGLANRRLFEELLAARLEEAARYGRPLAVLLLDLDGFKKVNDTYGHAAGDAVLVAVAGALRRGLRRSDLPARLAGDEFVALLPETDGRRALALAERVCAEVAALAVQVDGAVIHPSASVGAASTNGRDASDPAALLAEADGAAYAAKAAGKNAARLAGGRTPRRSAPLRQRARAAS